MLARIDDETTHHLAGAAERPQTIQARLDTLDAEWDIDRTLEAEAASMGLLGLALGTFVKPSLLALPATVGAAVFLFGTRGLYPLLPCSGGWASEARARSNGERYALKARRATLLKLQVLKPAQDTWLASSPPVH